MKIQPSPSDPVIGVAAIDAVGAVDLLHQDNQGEFVLECYKVEYDRQGKAVKGSEVFLGEFRTRSKADFVERVEQFMARPARG